MENARLLLATAGSAFGFSWNPDRDIPSLEGKVILVTGGSDGLGKESIHQLSKHNPDLIWLAARNRSKSEAAIADIQTAVPAARISFVELDLTSFSSIKAAAARITAQPNARLHTLMLNAGVMAWPAALTSEGYEIQFGTNHVGHSLLTELLLPTLRRTAAADPKADVRIVTLAGHAETDMAPDGGIRLEGVKSGDGGGLSTWERYGQSKVANVLYTKAFAQQEAEAGSGVKNIAVHPGIVKTNLASEIIKDHPWLYYPVQILRWVPMAPFLLSPYQGALNQLWAATSADAKNGVFYHPVGRESQGGRWSQDDALMEKLWVWTRRELEGHIE